MNKRKFLGTIIGAIFWTMCIVYFTYAYYEWKSINTNVVLGIQDLATQCNKGPNVTVTNIGPIFNPSDGVKVKFSLINELTNAQNFNIQLNITSISDNLLIDDFKWLLIKNDDYDSPIASGDFSSFIVGTNTIKSYMSLESNANNQYQFIVYIDGNTYNNPNMQNNSLISYLEIGNCGIIKEPTLMNTSSTNDFRNEAYLTNIKTASFVDYIDTTNASLDADNNPIQWDMSTAQDNGVIAWLEPNTEEGYYDLYIGANDTIYANSLNSLFYGMTGLTNIIFDNLDTSITTDMTAMFWGCSGLTTLDVSSFNTSNVTHMGGAWKGMFQGCSSLTALDVSNFDTSNVTSMDSIFRSCSSLTSLDLSNWVTNNVVNMAGMFDGCSSLTFLDITGFNTSKVTSMENMFNNCSSLTSLDLRHFNTSNVRSMKHMFAGCSGLTTLDVSSFNTSNVTTMGWMFSSCDGLTNLEINHFDTSNVTQMNYMFNGMNYVTTEITIRNPNTTYDHMFHFTCRFDGKVTVNYTSETSELVDLMIADNSNVVKGSLVA